MEHSPSKSHELYLKTYSCQSEAEITQVYDEWASTYDTQMHALNWEAPNQIANLLASAISIEKRATATVLDVGAGTGLVGLALSQLGFTTIDAFDVSSEMLKQAQTRGVYQRLLVGNAHRLSNPLDQQYDAVVCVGALNFGHIAPTALAEFVKATKPNGYVCFSTREDYYQTTSKAEQEELEHNGSWKLVTSKMRPTAIRDMPHRHWLYQVFPNRSPALI